MAPLLNLIKNIGRFIKMVATQKKTSGTEAEQEAPLWRRYMVTLRFIDDIAGGKPASKQLISSHIQLFSNRATNPMKLSFITEGEVSEEAMEEHLERCSTVFLADAIGMYLRGYQCNAMLKDAAQRTKDTIKNKGLNNQIRDGGLHFPNRLYLRDGAVIVETPSKPENANSSIKRFQTITQPELRFECAVLNGTELTDQLFRRTWDVAQGIGLGANRHLGYGRFRVQQLEDITHDPSWAVADLLESVVIPDIVEVQEH